MSTTTSRCGRWPLVLALAVLGACTDQPTTPTFSAPLKPNLAAGDVFIVTNTADTGIGSLRWALGFTTGGEIIRFDPTLAGQTIRVDSTLEIRKSVTIEGPERGGITIHAGGNGRAFIARFVGLVTMRNLSITGANSGIGAGSALYGDADLTLENSAVYGNTGGAGIAIVAQNIRLVNSTVSGNKTDAPTSFDYPAVMGITVTVINSTVAHNEWGGVGSFGGSVTIRNSIVSNNAGKNCVLGNNATLVREGGNVSDDDTCGGPSEIIIADPKLAALANNGGPALTHALLAGSPAINAATSCNVAVDQRYFPRDAKCDLGAYEFADFTTVTITIDPSPTIDPNKGWATLTGTVKCSRTETFKLALELHQPQRVGKSTVDVHSAATAPVTCTTTVRPWSASMLLTEGEFQSGSATATAATFEAQPWVAPAQASAVVKLFRARGK